MELELINVEESYKYRGGTHPELNFGCIESAKSTRYPNGNVKQAIGCVELQFRARNQKQDCESSMCGLYVFLFQMLNNSYKVPVVEMSDSRAHHLSIKPCCYYNHNFFCFQIYPHYLNHSFNKQLMESTMCWALCKFLDIKQLKQTTRGSFSQKLYSLVERPISDNLRRSQLKVSINSHSLNDKEGSKEMTLGQLSNF